VEPLVASCNPKEQRACFELPSRLAFCYSISWASLAPILTAYQILVSAEAVMRYKSLEIYPRHPMRPSSPILTGAEQQLSGKSLKPSSSSPLRSERTVIKKVCICNNLWVIRDASRMCMTVDRLSRAILPN